jgi:dTDP-glucose pyrophosphorylase
MKARLEDFLVSPQSSIREVMSCIDNNASGIAFVVDQERHLISTLSDGDIRRAILNGVQLDVCVEQLLGEKVPPRAVPVTVPQGTADVAILEKMNALSIRQIPLVDSDGRILDVAFLSELVKEYELPLRAVVMAGGYGSRLRPLTDNTPKPMLPIGGRPLLQRTIEQLKKSGVQRVDLTTHYKSEVITDHFGDGHEFGIRIEYIHEDIPLGTAGALRDVPAWKEPLLVINGDIVTEVNFRSLLDYHREHEAILTVGVRPYQMQVPYGVVQCQGAAITGISEKPKMNFFVNAGIYLLDPRAHEYIPSGRRFDMTDLIQTLIEKGCTVASFPIIEYWLDVGSPVDYEQAQRDARDGRAFAGTSGAVPQ